MRFLYVVLAVSFDFDSAFILGFFVLLLVSLFIPPLPLKFVALYTAVFALLSSAVWF